jgi:hypothetical protein
MSESLEERRKAFEEKWKVHRPLLLQRSLIEFREAYLKRSETGERAAYIEAIRALLGVLLYLEEPLNLSDEDPAYMWLIDLIRYLEDLHVGVVAPVFRAPWGSNALSTAEWMTRQWVVYDVELLHVAKGMKYEAAARRIIRGRKLHGVSEKDVLSWRKEFKKGRVKNREAAQLYEDGMAYLRGCGVEELQRNVARLFDDWAGGAAGANEMLSRAPGCAS